MSHGHFKPCAHFLQVVIHTMSEMIAKYLIMYAVICLIVLIAHMLILFIVKVTILNVDKPPTFFTIEL